MWNFIKKTGQITNADVLNYIEELRSMRALFTEGGYVTFQQMQAIPFATTEDKPFDIAPGIKCYRLNLPHEDFLLFKVVMAPGSSFGTHAHDCPEFCWITQGVATVDGADYRPFALLEFDHDIEHDVSTKNGSHLVVALTRPGTSVLSAAGN